MLVGGSKKLGKIDEGSPPYVISFPHLSQTIHDDINIIGFVIPGLAGIQYFPGFPLSRE